MKENVANILEQIKIVVVLYMIINVVQFFSISTNPYELMMATAVSFAMVVVAITVKNLVKKPNLPGFAWATLIAFFCTLPISPIGEFVVASVQNFNFMITGLPLLAFAGISVGDQLAVLRQLSWKIILVSFVVMTSTYFGAALIAETVLTINGMI